MADDKKIMDDQNAIYSNSYIENVVRVDQNDVEVEAKRLNALFYTTINDDFTIFYQPVEEGKDCVSSSGTNYYANISFLWGFNLENASSSYSISTGLVDARKEKNINLTGDKVIIGVVSTGINYMHESFIYEDDTSKVLSIWDQSIKGKSAEEIPAEFKFGTEYSSKQINEAIKSQDPYKIVPSKDEDGHGTFIAGVAAGRRSHNGRFLGMAPDSDLIVVKLKKAKQCIRDYYSLSADKECYQSSDLIVGVKYIVDKAKSLNRPVVILFTAETNNGPHDGTSYSEVIYSAFGDRHGVNFVASAGDEASSLHHYYDKFNKNDESVVEFNVASGETGLSLFIWSYAPDELDIQLLSPTGAVSERIKATYNKVQQISFGLEETKIKVVSTSVDIRSGDQSTFVTMWNPVVGIWTIKLYGVTVVDGRFHIWMPIKNFTNHNTIFLKPDPYVTVVTPCTNAGIIAVSAYDSIKNSIYVQSGRGYTRTDYVKPDIVAPGVNILGPGLGKKDYIVKSGSATAAAGAAGAAAKILQWGLINKNDITLNTLATRTIFIRGATRDSDRIYPNREWGYGVLNTYESIIRIGS